MQGQLPETKETKKKARPNLKLNTGQKSFEDRDILIHQHYTNSYVIQNHPILTDLTESASANKHKFGKFFTMRENDPVGDYFSFGEYYYVVQKSNGKEMQDRYKTRAITEQKTPAFFAVYDGHSTQVIAQLLTEKLDDYFYEEFHKTQDIDNAIKIAFGKIEKEVLNELQEWKPRGGSTALCSFLHNENLHVANLGDSRAVLFQDDGFMELSNLHDFTNENERHHVEQKGGTVLNNRLEGELAVSRSIGDINFKRFMNSEPEISSCKLTDKDEYLFLASDGFWNGLTPERCLENIKAWALSKGPAKELKDLKILGDSLIEEACVNVKTKKDNMTLIIVSLQDYHGKKKKSFKFS